MLTKQEIWWMTIDELSGFEGEGEGGEDGSGEGGTGEGGSGEAGSGAGEGGTVEGEGESKEPEDLSGLKSALAAARAEAKANKADKAEFKRLQKAVEAAEAKDKTELERAQADAQKNAEKATKLATRLRTQAVDVLIEREARALNFHDVEDAITQINRAAIEVEQDDDDPSDIKIDAKTVKAAVKALAEKKKHLIKQDDDDGGEPSGSRFNRGKGGPKQTSEEKLKEMYPALR